MGVVAFRQLALAKGPGAADAFGDILAGHLQMHAAGVDPLGFGDLDEASHLRQDAVEGPGLVAIGGLQGVAVHRVDRPDNLAAALAGGFHQPRQSGGDLVGAEAAIERQAARLVIGVEGVDQGQQLLRLDRRADLDADRVLHALHEVDVGAIELAGSLADPQQVGGGVVPIAGGGIDAGHGFLEAEQQGLVAGEELHTGQVRMALRRDANGLHERQGLGDLVAQLAVSRALRAVVDETQGPAVDVVQVGVTAAGEGAQQVQGRGRLAVGPDQPVGIRGPRDRLEVHAVDVVAAVGRQGDPVDRLDRF